ncbi:MAG: agmatinase family protein [Flavobacteriales bacterium]
MTQFDPNGVGIANGNIFGFPYTEAEADIVLIPVPWDATASYGKGTSKGPEAILEASTQLDFYHPDLPNAYDTKIYMSPVSEEWLAINADLCEKGMAYISYLEEVGEAQAQMRFADTLNEINTAHQALRSNLKERCSALLQAGKMPCVLGGEHSTPLGLLQALDAHYTDFGILQIDAHADLRDAYEGFEQSHASIMFNALKELKHLRKLTQVGIRDISEREVELAQTDPRIQTFYDWDLKNAQFEGKTWGQQVQDIIESLPQKVYISFDIDGLNPALCPHTGTPVAGGFELQQIAYLFFELVNSGRQIIGFDLNEVAPGPTGDWDANVGARALWHLVCATELSRRKQR